MFAHVGSWYTVPGGQVMGRENTVRSASPTRQTFVRLSVHPIVIPGDFNASEALVLLQLVNDLHFLYDRWSRHMDSHIVIRSTQVSHLRLAYIPHNNFFEVGERILLTYSKQTRD